MQILIGAAGVSAVALVIFVAVVGLANALDEAGYWLHIFATRIRNAQAKNALFIEQRWIKQLEASHD